MREGGAREEVGFVVADDDAFTDAVVLAAGIAVFGILERCYFHKALWFFL